MNPDSFYRSPKGGIVNQKTIPFIFILLFFWPTIPELIPEKGQKNSQGIGIGILLELELPQP